MQGQLSSQVIFVFTRTNAVLGDYLCNPLHLKHFNINCFSLHMNGQQIPTMVLHLNFVVFEANYMRSYMQRHNEARIAFCDDDIAINYAAFGRSSTLFIIDITADLPYAEHTDPTWPRNLWEEVCSGAAIEHLITSLTCIQPVPSDAQLNYKC